MMGVYAERLLSGPLPWARMRAAYALLRLCDKFGEGRVEAVCQSALAFDVVGPALEIDRGITDGDLLRLARELRRV